MKYCKPELVEITGFESFGNCLPGSGDSAYCYGNGNQAGGTGPDTCARNGNAALGNCFELGNSPGGN